MLKNLNVDQPSHDHHETQQQHRGESEHPSQLHRMHCSTFGRCGSGFHDD